MLSVFSLNKFNNHLEKKQIFCLKYPIKSKDRIQLKCKICNKIWFTTYSTFMSKKSGCSSCTHVELNKKLYVSHNKKRIKQFKEHCANNDIYYNKLPLKSSDIIEFNCLKCNRKWTNTLTSVLTNKSGCLSCNGNRVTNQTIDNFICKYNIERLSNASGSLAKIKFKCNNCNYIWEATSRSIFTAKNKCKNCCNKTFLLTNEIVDYRLLEKKLNIIRRSNCNGSASKALFMCTVCKHEWQNTVGNIIYEKRGCPHCNVKYNEKLIFKWLIENNIKFTPQYFIKYKLKKIFVDFYLPNINTIIEYNGLQHYEIVYFSNYSEQVAVEKLKNQIKRDNLVRNYCKNNYINLVEIDGRVYKNKKLIKYLNENKERLCK